MMGKWPKFRPFCCIDYAVLAKRRILIEDKTGQITISRPEAAEWFCLQESGNTK
jgi:hypothetical protein